MKHHFTIDVEEHFQVAALERHVGRDRWAGLESRVVESTTRMLDLLRDADARATCFVLGWVAERHPELVRLIAAEGHEVASHGHQHERVTTLSREAFRESVRKSKAILESIIGRPVLGYRAPSFSIVHGLEWALDILVEEGYVYDSSLFPIRRPGYGYAGGRRDVHVLGRERGSLVEVPPATLRVAGTNLPAAGGAYFRLLPYGLVRAALKEAERRRQPGTFYIHPWEMDAAQPRFAVPIRTRIRHYGRLTSTEPRLRRLLREFRFQSIAETVERREVQCLAS